MFQCPAAGLDLLPPHRDRACLKSDEVVWTLTAEPQIGCGETSHHTEVLMEDYDPQGVRCPGEGQHLLRLDKVDEGWNPRTTATHDTTGQPCCHRLALMLTP
uniref:Uncharacterized protein n=1 Tax=Eutreptiella gymnastica TaxID=73025 RepID=A0A7S4CEL6_9EUGL